MKQLCTIAIGLLFSINLSAQNSNSIELMDKEASERPKHPKHDWQIGTAFTNLIVQQFSVDANYRYFKNQVIGFGLSRIEGYPQSTGQDGDERPLLERAYKGWELAAYQKLYLNRSYVDNFIYFKHGIRGDLTEHSYAQEDWFEIYSDGNTFLNYEKRYFTENSFRMGYDAVFGIELYHGRFSTDIFAGAAYHFQLNKSAIVSDDFFLPSYSGLRPVFGLRFAVNIGKTEYDR